MQYFNMISMYNTIFFAIILHGGKVSGLSKESSNINWHSYDPVHLKATLRGFYKHSSYSYVRVPQVHESSAENDDKSIFNLYVRRFSSTLEPKNHIWMISGGPGCSTSGVERALSVQLPDTAVYIMDTRGLGHSHKLCHHSESQDCQKDPAKCYKRLEYSPKVISLHETAKDFNMISKMILEDAGGQGNVFMYGSSYGATLAYTAFKFAPNLYKGILLEAFVPNLRLREDIDIREHLVSSCFSSSTCFEAIGSKLTREEATGLMATIMDPETKNRCKSSLEYIASTLDLSVQILLNYYIRVSFYKKMGLRPAVMPLMYAAAYCPCVEEFNKLLSAFHESYMSLSDDPKLDALNGLLAPRIAGLHSSNHPNTNHFFGNHIRYSEYKYDFQEKFDVCVKRGYLNIENWTDICGMVFDYKTDYAPYLYEPEEPILSKEAFRKSQTRIVIASGKLDTQTPHDLAEEEFERIPLKEKYLFTADHAGHGFIDSWEVPGFTLDRALKFLMIGSEEAKRELDEAIDDHNAHPDRIWNEYDKKIFSGIDLWDVEPENSDAEKGDDGSGFASNYPMKTFLLIILTCYIPVVFTFVVSIDPKKRRTSKVLE